MNANNAPIPGQVRAAALSDYLAHPKWSVSRIAREHGVHESTVRKWIDRAGLRRDAYDPGGNSRYVGDEPSADEIARLVYRSIVATLRAIEARAIATADPQWIAGQNAADLAALEHAQREYALRAIASLRPVDALPEPDYGRDSTLDATA